MSTTDTRAAFEAHYRKECGMPDDVAIQWDTPYIAAAWDGWQSALTWQAATEAAKATGTAGEQTKQSFENIEELPPLPECAYVQHGPFANRDLFTVAQMREYGQACAEAARQPAPDGWKDQKFLDWMLSEGCIDADQHLSLSNAIEDKPCDYIRTEGAACNKCGKIHAATNRSQP